MYMALGARPWVQLQLLRSACTSVPSHICGSTVPREVFDSSVIMLFFLMCCDCDTSYIVSVHIKCQLSIFIYPLLCRGHSWRVRLAKQETMTPPGHLVHLRAAGVRECPPWCSIVGATVTVHQFFCILHI